MFKKKFGYNSNYCGWKNAYITAGGARLAKVSCYSNQYTLPFANLQFVRGEILQLCVREYFDQFDRTSVNQLTFKRRTVIEYCDYSRWKIHSHVIVFVCSFVCFSDLSLSVDPLPQHTCADFRNITTALLLIMLASGYSLPCQLTCSKGILSSEYLQSFKVARYTKFSRSTKRSFVECCRVSCCE